MTRLGWSLLAMLCCAFGSVSGPVDAGVDGGLVCSDETCLLAPIPEPGDVSFAFSETAVRGQGGGPKPWSMPQPCIFKKLGIRTGGWLEQGVTVNGYGNSDGFNGTVGTNDLDGEYQMNQLWLYITKPINTHKRGWDIGGHIDLIYGTDWRFGINNGLENRINGFERQTYGLVIP